MAQLGRFSYPVQDTSGNAVAGASVAVYREGATVNGNQSGASPTTFNVRHRGKIVTGDNVFVNAATGTLYAATVVSATQITLGGYVGTLSLTNGDRLTPAGSQPTLYSDDQGGATTSNPLTSSSTGRVQCWMEYGAYDLVLSGGGLTAAAFTSEVMPTEAPGLYRFASSFGGLTVASVQAALDELEELGGGTVYIPSNANIPITTTPIKIPKRCCLWGTGSQAPNNPTFTADASTTTTSMIENKTQDGTQQIAQLRNIHLDGGGKSGSAVLTKAALWLKLVFSGSYVKDCRITNVPSKGMLIEATTTATQGPFYLENNVVANTNDDCVVFNEGCIGLVANFLEVDRPGVGKAGVRIFHTPAAAAQSIGTRITNLYSEISGDTTASFLVVDNCANVSVDGAFLAPGGTPLISPIIIKGTGASKGGPSGFTLRNAYFEDAIANSVLIDDQASSVQVTAGPNVGNANRFVSWYSSPSSVGTIGNQTQGQIVGIQYQKQGPDITASATITPAEGNFFVVNGNTNITSVTASARDKGRVITLSFSGTPTFTDGSNLILAGNLVATADDTITLVCDGTNWREMCRSIN